jgi:hypothetical protein
MRATILCKLAALGLAAALCGESVTAGATVQKPPVATSDVVLVAQKHGKARRGRRGGIQQQIMQGAKKYLPPEYQQYLGGQGGGGMGGGMGGMGGGDMGGMGGGGMGR